MRNATVIRCRDQVKSTSHVASQPGVHCLHIDRGKRHIADGDRVLGESQGLRREFQRVHGSVRGSRENSTVLETSK